MTEKRFFTKVNSKGRLVIIDSECHTELFDMTLACEVLNRLDTKRKWLNEENGQLRKKIFDGLFGNCTLETKDDLLHLQYIFTLCKMLVDDAVEEFGNEDIEDVLELARESIYQFESRMKHFNQDKNGEKRVL